MRLRLAFLLTLFALSPIASAWTPTDHIVQRSWLSRSDLTTLSEDIRSESGEPFKNVYSGGYDKNTIWIRLRVDPSISGANPQDTLYLRVRPAYLDQLALFDPLQEEQPILRLGDMVPSAAQRMHGLPFIFALPAGAVPRDIWIRLNSTSTRLAAFDIFTLNDLQSANLHDLLLSTFYLTAITMFIVWGLFRLAMSPEPLLASFALYQGVQFLFAFSMLGFTRMLLGEILPPELIDFSTSLLGILAPACVSLFYYFLFRDASDSRFARWSTIGSVAIFLSLAALAAGNQVSLALRINMLLVFSLPFAFLLVATVGTRPHDSTGLPKSVLIGYFVISCGLTMLAAAPGLGWVEAGITSIYAILIYALVTGILTVAMLQYRSHRQRKRQQRLVAESVSLRAQAEQERSSRLDREKLLTMLGHELKTPLATMRMLLINPQIEASLQSKLKASVLEMNNVIERVAEATQIEDGIITVRPEDCDLLGVIRDVVESFEDRHRIQMQWDEARGTVIRIDRHFFSMILRNLLDNALKYSAADSAVTVGIADNGHLWRCTISNSIGRAGCPDPEQVFKKYYRHPQASHRSGSGLGLYMIHSIAKALNLKLAYSTDNETVHFTLEQANT